MSEFFDFLNFASVLLRNVACLVIAIATGAFFRYVTKRVSIVRRGYYEANKKVILVSIICAILAFIFAKLLLG